MIACLLPARNAAADLPGWFEGVAAFADAVVALDDGSTDDTGAVLDASQLVRTLLRNPRRDGYAGWDDARNRQRLLDAAVELGADWVVFLDADERIDADDAAALREFLEGEAIAGCAYGFRLYRDWGPEGVDPRPTMVYRCFAARPGLTLPARRLHPVPVPESIPKEAHLKTTIRVRHLYSEERAVERTARYAEADPEGTWDRPEPDPDREGAKRVGWAPRPAHLPVLAPSGVRPDALFERSDARRSRIACLLPVRNGEGDLPGYLDSAAAWADAVIALDDGSTDSTREILEASDLVTCVLSNPPRDSYEGWDDRANRQRLLAEARAHPFDWLFFLDCDERLTQEDGAALRDLIANVARPEFAYGFRVFRMLSDSTFDQAGLWVYRLFSRDAPGDLPNPRLHFVPVPRSLGPREWVRTTIRIQHLGSLDDERRSARAAKYEEADPLLEFQTSYANLLAPAEQPKQWRERPAGFPLLADRSGKTPLDLTSFELSEKIVISAVVIARNDAGTIERAVRAILQQECGVPFEVIVAASGNDGTAALVRQRFPQVRVVDVPEPGLPGMARNAGLAIAQGRYVTFPGSHVELLPGSLEAIVSAHELGWSMVTGVVENGTKTRAGWASYFLDAATGIPGGESGPLLSPPVRCSYEAEALSAVGGFPADMRAGEDTVVNRALWNLGYRAYRSTAYRLRHDSPCTTVPRLLAHHFGRGRAYGRILAAGSASRSTRLRLLAGWAGRRVHSSRERTHALAPELAPAFSRSRSLIWAAALAASAGATLETLRPAS